MICYETRFYYLEMDMHVLLKFQVSAKLESMQSEILGLTLYSRFFFFFFLNSTIAKAIDRMPKLV